MNDTVNQIKITGSGIHTARPLDATYKALFMAADCQQQARLIDPDDHELACEMQSLARIVSGLHRTRIETDNRRNYQAYMMEECTCTPLIDAACPACQSYTIEKYGDEIPY